MSKSLFRDFTSSFPVSVHPGMASVAATAAAAASGQQQPATESGNTASYRQPRQPLLGGGQGVELETKVHKKDRNHGDGPY